jgi:hypothetical protein
VAATLVGLPFAQAAQTTTTRGPQSARSTPDPVSLTATLAQKTVRYQQTDSVSGTVRYNPDPSDPAGPDQPLPGTPVTIQSSQPGSAPISVLTDDDGEYTANLPRQTVTATWTISAGGTPTLELAQQTLTLDVLVPTGFRQVVISVSAFRELNVKACLNVTSPGGSEVATDSPVTLQYAPAAKGPWKKLRTIKPRDGIEYCKQGTSIWQASVVAPLANAYYRLSFAGNSILESSTSSGLHRWRYRTKITAFKISPRRVTAMGAVTVSGRLWRHTRSWRPYAGRKVVILFRYHGRWFFYEHKPRTNWRGYFSGLFTVYVTSHWIAQYDGDKKHFASATKQLKVTVISGSGGRPVRRAAAVPRMAGLRPLT